MTANRTELEVDFIGGLGPLTLEEEKAINEYIKTHKTTSKNRPFPRKHHLDKKSKSAV